MFSPKKSLLRRKALLVRSLASDCKHLASGKANALERGIRAQRSESRIAAEEGGGRTSRKRDLTHMLYWALMFFVVALVAAVLGFGGISIAAAGIAKILFFVFLVLFLVSLVTHLSRRV